MWTKSVGVSSVLGIAHLTGVYPLKGGGVCLGTVHICLGKVSPKGRRLFGGGGVSI